MKKNVFVFPCGSEIGLEVHRALGYSTHVNLIGGSSVDDHGEFVFDTVVKDIPFVDHEDFLSTINQIVDTHNIDIIIPAHDSVVLKLAQAKAEGKLSCDVMTSPAETCEVSRSKKMSYDYFAGVIPTPKVFGSAAEVEESDFPVFLKPDVGQGSKGTYTVKTREDIEFYMSKDPSILILEHLPGKEYTVDCFTNKDGELVFCEGRERNRINNGISVNSFTVEDTRFREVAEKINQKLKFRGVWFFQVKEGSSKDLVLMEIAPRIAGTMGLVRGKGVNLVLLSIFDLLGQEVAVFENNYTLSIDRALENRYKHDIIYKHAYIDFDDLVIFEGKVNVHVMAFIYQCINKSVKVHLITRHRDDLDASLAKYKLAGIFDEIIWLQNNEDKHSHITEQDAIFVDDSFSERKKVHDALGIPVFDAHMIEALMEKF